MSQRDIFIAALQKDDLAERRAYLDEVCETDAALRAEIEGLLRVHQNAGSFLEPPAQTPLATMDSPVSERSGTAIGPYKLLQQIGEGGMGVVWMAEQQQPVQRKVALKVIKPGMDSQQVIARFEAERQALAMMDHPNIAKVFDAGTTESGRPYFVMELVKGESITKYCDEHRLTPRQRLELFLPVCQAIQHAHQKGVIHRDIKASNVLIAPYDGKPVVKVIDFGIAKATGQRLTDKTLFTEFGAVVGTFEYMSPEQAELNNQDIDTRSDIYSLGVLLYELLTGTTPLDRTRLKQAAYAEILRMIKEEEPPKPSTRLSESGEALTSISAQRQTEPAKLSKLMRGELDWIVMKTLEKDRNRRYETANAFAADIQRYLSDEPVQACPPSAGYRLRKFARRNKGALATTALLVVMLLAAVGAVASAIGWGVRNRTALEEEVARDRTTRQIQLHKETTALLDDVERQRAEIHVKLADPIKVCELLSKIDGWRETLAKARAAWQNAKNLAASNDDILSAELAERLQHVGADLHADEADWKIAKKLDDIRLGAATLVDGHWDLTKAAPPKYEQVFRDLGFDRKTSQPAQIASKIQQGKLRYVLVAALDDWALKSKFIFFQHFEIARLVDPDPWRDQVRKEKLNVRALEKLAREVDPGRQSPQILDVLASRLIHQKGDASALLRSALMHYPQDFWLYFDLGNIVQNPDQKAGYFQAALALRPTSSPAHSNLGMVLIDKKDFEGAIRHFRKALEMDPNFVIAHYGLGNALREKKDPDGAIQHYRKALLLHPGFASAHINLGIALFDKKDHDGAIQHYRKALDLDPNLALAYNNIGVVLLDKKDPDGAIQHFRKALDQDPDFTAAHHNLGNALLKKKDRDSAIHHYRKALDLDPSLVQVHNNVGSLLHEKKDFDGAIRHFRKALDLDPNFAMAHVNFGLSLCATNDFDGGIKHFRKALDLDATSSMAHYNLGTALRDKKDLDGAIRHFRKSLDLDPKYASAHQNLAVTLSDKKDFDGAIKHYRKAFELNPKHAGAHFGIANALRDKNDVDGAIPHFRKAIALDPQYAKAYNNLGSALMTKRDFDAAIYHFRKAIDLDPNYSRAHRNLGIALSEKNDLAGAIGHYRNAIDLNPNYAEAHCGLGTVLSRNGQFKEALESMRRGHELGSKQPGWPLPSAKWVQECERGVKLDNQLPAVLNGEVQPTRPQEWLAYVEICQVKKSYASAFHLWKQLFLKNPALADNPKAGYRARAAQDAVAASGSPNQDAGKITDVDRSAMRKQAREWLHADLDSWSKQFQKKQPSVVFALSNALSHWQKSTNLAGVRDEQHLAKLPEEERKSWQKLWTEVEQLRKQALAMFKETNRFAGMVTSKQRELIHEVELRAGTTYVIDLESNAFDTFLRLKDADGTLLADNDDIEDGINLNSRLIFTPPTDGIYRLTASAFDPAGAGPYTLTIREFVK